jgi:uncharacterized repeat protein (TIGR01451 family)
MINKLRSFILLLSIFSYQSLLLLNSQSAVVAQVTDPLCATPGKDGDRLTLSSVINTYYPAPVTATASSGSTSIPVVDSPVGGQRIQAGDLLLVIQMQGVDIDSSNSPSYGSFSGGLNIAGNYEYVVATGEVSGGSVPIRGAGGGGLINTYINAPYNPTQGQRTYQVIRVPQYLNATLSGITTPAWNGSTGGIVVFDVADNLDLGNGIVDVSGKGFRGGGGRRLTGGSGSNTDYVTLSTNNANGSKGEGTAGTPRFLFNGETRTLYPDSGIEGYPGGNYGRGAPGTAGGGSTDGDPTGSSPLTSPPRANDENSGGGGGGNGGNGGQGGKSWFSGLDVGGGGGASFSANTNRVVLGGGGGAGTTNEGTNQSTAEISDPLLTGIASSGATGGGMVLLRTKTLSGNGTFRSNGANAFNVGQDGAGGGGAGGSVVVSASQTSAGSLTVEANGGRGGSVRFSNNSQPNGGAHGPGGGGGGGVVLYNGVPNITVSAQGGDAGLAQDRRGNIINPTNQDTRSFGAKPGGSFVPGSVTQIAGIKSGAECIAQPQPQTGTQPQPQVIPDTPRLRAVKRITNVLRNGVPLSGVEFNRFVDDPNDPNDNAIAWSQLPPVGRQGIDASIPLFSGDEVEYTIYFLVENNEPIRNARFCDPIPVGTSFSPDSFGSGNGILVNTTNTITPKSNAVDGDNGSFFSPVAPLPDGNLCPNQSNPTGAVIVNLGDISNATGTNFGFVRFRVRVD